MNYDRELANRVRQYLALTLKKKNVPGTDIYAEQKNVCICKWQKPDVPF